MIQGPSVLTVSIKFVCEPSQINKELGTWINFILTLTESLILNYTGNVNQ